MTHHPRPPRRPRLALPQILAATRAVVLAAALALGACDDGVAAVERPPSHPLVGTYDFVARFTEFSFEISPSDPQGPQSGGMYCSVQRDPGEARLAGTFVICDTVVIRASPGQAVAQATFHDVRGTFAGRCCETVDAAAPTGCGRMGASTTVEYPPGTVPTGSPMSDSAAVFVLLQRAASSGSVRLQGARFHRDSLYGEVYWAETMNRRPPTCRGTFVARRRTLAADVRDQVTRQPAAGT